MVDGAKAQRRPSRRVLLGEGGKREGSPGGRGGASQSQQLGRMESQAGGFHGALWGSLPAAHQLCSGVCVSQTSSKRDGLHEPQPDTFIDRLKQILVHTDPPRKPACLRQQACPHLAIC